MFTLQIPENCTLQVDNVHDYNKLTLFSGCVDACFDKGLKSGKLHSDFVLGLFST